MKTVIVVTGNVGLDVDYSLSFAGAGRSSGLYS
jgi:hypothetical protein